MDDCRTHREVIAESSFCRIEQCACETVHLTIGPLTMRLCPDVITSLWSTLGEAVQRISARRAGIARTPAREARPS